MMKITRMMHEGVDKVIINHIQRYGDDEDHKDDAWCNNDDDDDGVRKIMLLMKVTRMKGVLIK